jgi:hypothetical protein
MDSIYNNYDSAKGYERLLFRPERGIQSAELNELQSLSAARLRGIADVLFKEGDIIKGCQCILEAGSGAATLEAGVLYVAGCVRGIGPGQLAVPITGTVTVGAYLQTDTITELQDPGLYNPAAGTRGYEQAGAARERILLVWGVAGDGTPGRYYPVWNITDGLVLPKEPPPNIDAVTQAIARYDRDSAGGTYVVTGLDVTMGADLDNGQQLYNLREGAARVGGNAVLLAASRRIVYEAQPDLQWVDSEPHVSGTEAAQRVKFDRAPLIGAPAVRLQARKTVTLVHGGFTGIADPLPDHAVLAVDEVRQGGTVYSQGPDYVLRGGQIDWSPDGAEPAPGSTYQVTYQYMLQAAPQDVDAAGCTVSGALPGTLILVSYHYALARIDRLCMDAYGALSWVKGVSSNWTPVAPKAPQGSLGLALVYQTWDARRRLTPDGARMVPMETLSDYQSRIDKIKEDLAEVRLSVDVSGRYSGIKKGLFCDPFLSNEMRDQGVPQDAWISGGGLRLPMTLAVTQLGLDITGRQSLPHDYAVAVSQPAVTGAMPVNPYLAFAPIPADLTLIPATDRWTVVSETWAASTTSDSFTGTQTLSESTAADEFLRPISVRFTVSGFGPGERINVLAFDSIRLAPQPLPGTDLIADTLGRLSGAFDIPPGIPAGAKDVIITGTGGSVGFAVFTGQGQIITRELQQVTAPPPPPVVVDAGGNASTPKGTPAASFGPTYTPPPGDDRFLPKPSYFNEAENRLYFYTPWSIDAWDNTRQGGWGYIDYNTGIRTYWDGSTDSAATGNLVTWKAQAQGTCTTVNALGLPDPLCETFSLPAQGQIAGVDLWFTAIGARDIIVQVRETENGMPTRRVIAQARVHPAGIVPGQMNRVTWPPVTLDAGHEYGITVLCDDDVAALGIAELGKFDTISGAWVTSQPYQVGVLLSSSNASTWTAHQDRDLTFAVLSPRYSATERVIDLGAAQLTGCTDLMVQGYAHIPSSDCSLIYRLEIGARAPIEVSPGQAVDLGERFTGAVKVSALLRGTPDMSPVMEPGVQLIAASLAASGAYVTPMIAAAGAGTLRVIFEASLPSGSAVEVSAQLDGQDGWSNVPFASSSPYTAGVAELTHELRGIQTDRLRLRLRLTGGPTARPVVHNLRAVILA